MCVLCDGAFPLPAVRRFTWVGVLLWAMICLGEQGARAEDPVSFEIRQYELLGNTLFTDQELQTRLRGFTGTQMNANDVEEARTALESFHHEKGYPTVLVNIPEQTVEDGLVYLQVIESKIRRVKVTGNRYFTMDNILSDLPSFAPGEVLYIPRVQMELGSVNRNRDLEVTPVLIPGKKLGTINVELKVKDHLPLHGHVELNNRSGHETEDLRLNVSIGYDNLWQREHSVSLQYQTAPQETSEVEVFALSYVWPAPWNDQHVLAVYGIQSDSETATGEGFEVVGKGTIFGARWVVPLPPNGDYAHNVTVGIDYKDFDEELGTGTGEPLYTPITYLPLSFSYSASLPDRWGATQFSGGLNMALRGLVTDQREFEIKRYQATGNYLLATLGVERMQALPWKLRLFTKVDGQVASQPLISNEQYYAGGMQSVRGYKESEEAGDDAIHGTVELHAPDLGALLGWEDRFNCRPFLFYDVAAMSIQDPLPEEDGSSLLEGIGGGLRGTFLDAWEFEVAWAMALEDTGRIGEGDMRTHFKIRYVF